MADTPISVPSGRMELTDDSLKLLLHMDGADASTTFTDETGRTVSRFGNAQIDDATYVYGGASGLFDGTGDYLTVPNSSDFQATGDFTVEAFINIDVNNRTQTIATKRPTDSGNSREYFFSVGATGLLGLTVWGTTGNIVSMSGVTVVSTATWHHVAATKSGTTWYIYLDGALENSAVESDTYGTGSQPFTVGRDPTVTTRDIDGHIDELAVFKNRALYTSAFIPRTSPIAFTRPTVAVAVPTLLSVSDGAVSVVGSAPSLAVTQAVAVASASASISGESVQAGVDYYFSAGAASAGIVGGTPQSVVGIEIAPGNASVSISGAVASEGLAWSTPSTLFVVAGSSPLVYIGSTIPVGNGDASALGGVVSVGNGLIGASSSVAVAGNAPTLVVGRSLSVPSGEVVVVGANLSIPVIASPSYNVIDVDALF